MSPQAAAPSKDQYLYVLVRSDLPAGLQIAQASHGAFEFSRAYPAATHRWLHDSNYIVILHVPDEASLLDHAQAVLDAEIDYCLVYEPDVEANTALVVGPSSYWRKLANLPCALREPAMT